MTQALRRGGGEQRHPAHAAAPRHPAPAQRLPAHAAAPPRGGRPSRLPAHVAAPLPHGRHRLALLALLVVPLVLVLRGNVATPVRISSDSMLPTLARGDVVLVDPAVSTAQIERGDLVLFASPTDGSRTLKRVVGLPGEVLAVRDAVLHVDGRPVDEPYVDHEVIDAYYSRTFEVPVGTVFVMGDNRGNSEDSREFGPVAVSAMQGEVLVRLWPPVRVGGPQPSAPKP